MNPSQNRQKAERRGRNAEALAAFFLRAKGFRILNQRYKTPMGELDLVARRGRTIVFIEVKWRSTLDAALGSIHPNSQARIGRAASHWLSRQQEFANFNTRFDVIALAPWRWPIHLKQAFDLSDLI